MRKEIHIWPVILATSDWRYRFWILSHSCEIISIRTCSQIILGWFFNTFATVVGRGGRGWVSFPLRQRYITCKIDDSRWGGGGGGGLLRSPQHMSTFLSLSQILSPLLYWKICMTSSMQFSQFLGQEAMFHVPIFSWSYQCRVYWRP